MAKPSKRKIWYFLVYSAIGLAPAMALACGEAPVDSSVTSSSASLRESTPAQSGAVLAANEDNHAGARGPWGQERLDRLFQRFDKDGDGKIALKDLPERLRERLVHADTNNDGQVTREEVTKAWESASAEMKKKIDTNGDGVISDEERVKARVAFWDKRFAELDQNKDGALTSNEVPARVWSHIKVADANTDGKISRVEIDAALASGKLKPIHPANGHREHSDHAKA